MRMSARLHYGESREVAPQMISLMSTALKGSLPEAVD